uniref:Phage protein n=1 Tax=Salmonella phage vB_SEnST11_KE22 TaxID=3161173 RepID=A0AAU8GER1_9CAUD
MNVTNSSMKQAFGVLKVILEKTPELAEGLQAYANCREQGFSITKWDFKSGKNKSRQVSFSECRNSDQINVYWGSTDNFDYQTNVPDNDTYFARRKFFGYEKYEEAADWIIAYLEGGSDGSK